MNLIKKVVCSVALPCLTATSVSAAPGAGPTKSYPAPNGVIVYRVTTAAPIAMNMDLKMTWMNYGKNFRQDMTMHLNLPERSKSGAVATRPTTMKSWVIYDGKSTYTLIPNQNKVLRVSMSPQEASQTLHSIPGMDSFKRMSVANVGESGKIVGHAIVLGKPATIRSAVISSPQMDANGKFWIWQSLPLRMEMTMKFKQMQARPHQKSGGTRPPFKAPNMSMSMVATSLDLNAKPSPSLFVLPNGVVVQDLKDFQKQFSGMMRGPRAR